MNRLFIILSIIFLITATWLFTYIWNPIENGPSISKPSIFFGCYQSGSNKILISRKSIIIIEKSKSISIVRFFYLKNKAAIETIENLDYSTITDKLTIGRAESGFFYTFDSYSKPSILLIPDNAGIIRNFSRISC